MAFKEYKGCLHVHLSLDKNKGSVDEIVSAARNSCLDFLILTPHTPYGNRWSEYFSIEGYKDRVLILSGEEADEKSSLNHILVYGNKDWVGRRKIEDIIKKIAGNSYLSFAAHPDGRHMLFGLQTDHRWTETHLLYSLTGMEVWSLLFDFASKTNPSNLVVRYFSFPENLRGPFNSTLNLWDRIAKEKKFIGVAGLDIHPLRYGFKYLDIKKTFEYEFVFRTLRNHILTEKKFTGNSEMDIDIIVNAFTHGRIFFANDYIADSTGFFFGTEDKNKTMGDSVKINESLLIELPEQADIIIKFSRQTILFKKVKGLVFKPESSGPCRVEVYFRKKPWIFSNHIYIEKL